MEKAKIKMADDTFCMAEIGRASLGLFHDILNPVGSLMLYLDLVHKRGDFNQQTKKDIKQAIKSSQKIRDFIKEMQRDLHTYRDEFIEINEIINQVIKILSHRALVNNVSIVFASNQKTYIFNRKFRIYQILINLITNAIDSFEEFNSIGKNIVTITTEESKSGIIIRIKDNGCGISKEKLNKIFDGFYTTKKSGFGFGLYNTKKIIDRDFGGQIIFHSEIKNGTLCEITLPKITSKNH